MKKNTYHQPLFKRSNVFAVFSRKLMNYIVLCCFLCLAFGCKKILDIKPGTNTQLNPRFIGDFEQILNNEALASPDYLMADLMSDDVMLTDIVFETFGSINYVKAYRWWPVIWDPAEDDLMYNNSYRMILQSNVILSRLNAAPDGSPAQKNTVAAQAKINRAYYYFQLANLYGKGYNSSTAANDLAVPLILVPDASQLLPRASVQQVYHQINTDLQDAINTPELPDVGVNVVRPGKLAALALQARVYLFMGNYTKALETANAVLVLKSGLLDYNSFSFIMDENPTMGVANKPLTLVDQTNNPETLLARVCTNKDYVQNTIINELCLSKDLWEEFEPTDLRLKYHFRMKTLDNGTDLRVHLAFNGGTDYILNCGIGVPEMLLIKAECLARAGDATAALAQIELLRKFRFTPADYSPLINTGAENALRQVLAERRRELFLHGGLRLFDLKRLNMDPRFSKEIKRISPTDGRTIETIQPNSPNFLVPFAPKVLAANPNILPNAR